MVNYKLPSVSIGTEGEQISSIGYGCMRMLGGQVVDKLTPAHIERVFELLETAIEQGITFFDHADIYGRTKCESAFGEYLEQQPEVRKKIFIATKCGIIFADQAGPQRYDLSYDYVLKCFESSAARLHSEVIDLYQLHRPDPLTHPRETARALNQLIREKKVRYVGVSNHSPSQLSTLQYYLDVQIASTQPKLNLWDLEWLDDGMLDSCMEKGIRPLAYSPLAKGALAEKRTVDEHYPAYSRTSSLWKALESLGEKYLATPAQLSLAWLMHHPAGIVPIIGTSKPENIRESLKAAFIKLSKEDCYTLWVASRGVNLP